jgi:hypothetical protein
MLLILIRIEILYLRHQFDGNNLLSHNTQTAELFWCIQLEKF